MSHAQATTVFKELAKPESYTKKEWGRGQERKRSRKEGSGGQQNLPWRIKISDSKKGLLWREMSES